MNRAWLIAAALIAILLVAVVFAPVPGGTAWIGALHDFAHGPIFGCVAALLLAALRASPLHATSRRVQYALALMGAAALGLASEVAQIPAGRDASWMDARNDVLGAVAFLGLLAAFDSRTWRSGIVRAGALVVGLVVLGYLLSPVARTALAYRQRALNFPVLADWTRAGGRPFSAGQGVLISHAALPEALSTGPGEFAGHTRFLPQPYAGVHLYEPSPDWSGYSTLAIEAANPTARPLDLVVRVHDAHHDNSFADRYNQRFTLAPGARNVHRFSLADVERAPRGRRMDMRRIAGVIVFRAETAAPDEMYLVRIWLE